MSRFGVWLFSVLIATLLGVVQFVVCTLVAMAHYPDGYSLTENYLSELGRASLDYAPLFNGSLALLGICLMPLFATLVVVDRRQDSLSLKITAGLGILSALGLIGLAATPFDRHFFLHHVALAVWLFPMLYMTVVFFYAASRHPYVGAGFLAAGFVMAVAMIAVLLSTEIPTYVMLQKVIVVCGLIWLSFIVLFVFQTGLRILREEPSGPDAKKVEEAAYMAGLYRQQATGTERMES